MADERKEKVRHRGRARVVWAVLVAIGWVIPDLGVLAQAVPEVGRPGKDVMWVPSPDPLVDTMLEIAGVTADDVVMDLGSGDGRTVIAAARLGARAIGVEYDPELVEHSRIAAARAGVADRTTFIQADLFEVDLSPATVITMFLLPELNTKLRPRLLTLAPGTRIVSNTWDLEDWPADEMVQLDPCPGFCTALLWIVPADVAGTWQMPGGVLTLDQRFQVVSGVLDVDGARAPVDDGRLDGTAIEFRVGRTRYRGEVRDGAIEGVAETDDRRWPWRATALGSR